MFPDRNGTAVSNGSSRGGSNGGGFNSSYRKRDDGREGSSRFSNGNGSAGGRSNGFGHHSKSGGGSNWGSSNGRSPKPAWGGNSNSRGLSAAPMPRRRDTLGEDSDSEVSPSMANFTTIKNFYDESKQLVRRDIEEVNRYYDEEKIAVTGVNAPIPFMEFSDFAWPKLALQLFRRNNYAKPTPIQAQCWPIALSGRDLIGIAVTGSGKTLGYTLPAFMHIEGNADRRGRGPMVIVLAPTRELAQQIDEVVNQFSYISSVCVYGGAPRGPQISKLQRDRPDIVIATPGRLIDYLREGIINLHNVSYIVLDEADRMLDMGFEPQIRKIFKRIPAKDRQTLMFSATWPKEVRRLAEDFLNDPVQVKIGSTELQANINITQIVDVCRQSDKLDKLFELLTKIMQNRENKTIIFADMKKKVDYLARMLKAQRYSVAGIHGDKSQTQRNFILNGFKSNKYNILIATDVAARGLDVEDIKYVINFDYPNCSEDYVHRIGRTGRRENKGVAYTFFTDEDEKQAYDLVKVLQQAKQDVHPQLLAMANRQSSKNSRQWGNWSKRKGGDYNDNRDFGNKRFKRF